MCRDKRFKSESWLRLFVIRIRYYWSTAFEPSQENIYGVSQSTPQQLNIVERTQFGTRLILIAASFMHCVNDLKWK
jgi:hypothetical protein